jgi:hypothetical protein
MARFACPFALLGVLLMGTGCQRASAKTDGSSAPSSVAKAPAEDATGAQKAPASAAPGEATSLCQARPRCEIRSSRTSKSGVTVVEVLLRVPADAGDDECNRREHWGLTAGAVPRLLAVDCDQQRSAEEAAAAQTKIDKDSFVVDYIELQASDRCERYQARLDLVKLVVTSEARWEGTTDARGCHPKKRLTQLAPHGDGSAGKPILRLHTDWTDLHPAAGRK